MSNSNLPNQKNGNFNKPESNYDSKKPPSQSEQTRNKVSEQVAKILNDRK